MEKDEKKGEECLKDGIFFKGEFVLILVIFGVGAATLHKKDGRLTCIKTSCRRCACRLKWFSWWWMSNLDSLVFGGTFIHNIWEYCIENEN